MKKTPWQKVQKNYSKFLLTFALFERFFKEASDDISSILSDYSLWSRIANKWWNLSIKFREAKQHLMILVKAHQSTPTKRSPEIATNCSLFITLQKIKKLYLDLTFTMKIRVSTPKNQSFYVRFFQFFQLDTLIFEKKWWNDDDTDFWWKKTTVYLSDLSTVLLSENNDV